MFDPIKEYKRSLESRRLSRNSIAHAVGHVRQFCQKFNIDGEVPDSLEFEKKITVNMVKQYFDEVAPQCGQEKFNQISWSIRRFLKMIMWKGERLSSCFAVIPKQKKPFKKVRKPITHDELIHVIEPRLAELFPTNTLQVKTILYFLFFTSMYYCMDKVRLTEIKRKAFDLDNNELVLVIPKRYIGTRILLFGTLATLLRQYFASEEGKQNAFNITQKMVNGIFATLKKREILGPQRLIWKGIFKKSYASFCEEKSLNFDYIQSLVNEDPTKVSEIRIDLFIALGIPNIERKKNYMELVWRKCDHRDRQKYCLMLYRQLRRYCVNPNSKLYWEYGGKNIKCEFTSAVELEWVYQRDQVDRMWRPRLKRLNRKGSFSRENCVFIDREITLKEFLNRF